jgi:hypothetical protein
MGRALLAAIDELARACPYLDDYSTGASAALVPLSAFAGQTVLARQTVVAISTRSAATNDARAMRRELAFSPLAKHIAYIAHEER